MEITTTQNTLAQDSTVEMVAIIRDKDGNPRFDDIHNVPDVIIKALTPSDLEYLNKLRSK